MNIADRPAPREVRLAAVMLKLIECNSELATISQESNAAMGKMWSATAEMLNPVRNDLYRVVKRLESLVCCLYENNPAHVYDLATLHEELWRAWHGFREAESAQALQEGSDERDNIS